MDSRGNLLSHPMNFNLTIDDEEELSEASNFGIEVIKVQDDGNEQQEDWTLNVVVHFNVNPADVITFKERPKAEGMIVTETKIGLKRLIGLPILAVNDKDISQYDSILLQEMWEGMDLPLIAKFGAEPLPVAMHRKDSLAPSSTYQSFEDTIDFLGQTTSIAYDDEVDNKVNEALNIDLYDDMKVSPNDQGNFLEKISEEDESAAESSDQRPISYAGTQGDQSNWSKNCKKRAEIIKELLSTEKTYINGLEELHKEFLKPFAKVLKKSTGVDLASFEEKIANLIRLHKHINDRFEKAENICTVFKEEFAFVKMYKPYIKDYEETFRHLREASKKRSFKWIFNQGAARVSANPLGFFQDRGITIVQRPPRYILLLEQLIKRTPARHPMYRDLKNGLSEIQVTCGDINGYLQQLESKNKLFELSEKIDSDTLRQRGVKQLVVPARRLIMMGEVAIKKYKPSRSFYRRAAQDGNSIIFEAALVVMCNDILLISRGKRNRVIRVFNLAEIESLVTREPIKPTNRDQRFEKVYELVLKKRQEEEIRRLKSIREQERESLMMHGSQGSGIGSCPTSYSLVRLRQASFESIDGEEFSIFLSTLEQAEEWAQLIFKYSNLD